MPAGYSTDPWNSDLFDISVWRYQCMLDQVSRCGPMPTGDFPASPRQLPQTRESQIRGQSIPIKQECCPVYMKGGYAWPFPPYMTQMKDDNTFYARQDFPTQSFLPLYPPDPQYNPMTYLYPNIKK